ncbi:MAG: hypothetical protein WAO02_09750 [Verrucomicrobiia bacterium]
MWKTWRAFEFLFKGPVILGLLVILNAMTSPGHWWVQWVALGIGFVWILSLLRVLRALILLGGLAALIACLRKRKRDGWRVAGDCNG